MLRISGRWHISLNSWYDCRKRLFFRRYGASIRFRHLSGSRSINRQTERTIRRKISDGVIAESQTHRENGHVTISVAELERVFGKLRRPRTDMSGDTDGHDRTVVREMSGTATDVLREYLDFTKHQLEFEQRRNDRLERALEEMRDGIKRTQEQLSRLLPIAKPPRTDPTTPADTTGHGRTKKGTNVRTHSRWKFWKRRK